MLATVLSSTIVGLDGRVIRVEVDVAPGLPGFTIVGLADAALQEARERVRAELRADFGDDLLGIRRAGSRPVGCREEEEKEVQEGQAEVTSVLLF